MDFEYDRIRESPIIILQVQAPAPRRSLPLRPPGPDLLFRGCDRERAYARGHRGLKIEKNRSGGTAATLPQEPALELEEDPQHLGNDEDHLAVGDIQEERLPHPLAPFLKPLGMTGWTEASGAAGEHKTRYTGQPYVEKRLIQALLRPVGAWIIDPQAPHILE